MCTHVHMYKKSHILPRTKTKRGLSIGSHLNESEGRGEILDPPGEDLAKCCARRCSTYCLMSSGSRVVRGNRAAGRLCSPEPGKGSSRRHRVPRQPSGASRRPALTPWDRSACLSACYRTPRNSRFSRGFLLFSQ